MQTTGIIFDIKRFAVHDGPGIRTTVFFKGCPLQCWWCHNPESRRMRPERMTGNSRGYCGSWRGSAPGDVVGREVTVAQVLSEVERDAIFYDESGGGVTFSGGEPLVQVTFLLKLLTACSEKGLHTAVDTSGYAPWEALKRVAEQADLVLYDLKLMDDAAHRRYVQVGNDRILENLARLDQTGVRIIVRVPMIPRLTDTDDNLRRIASYVRPLTHVEAIHLLPYNPIGEGKYERLGLVPRLSGLRPQPVDELEAKRALFDPLPIPVLLGDHA